MSNFTFTCVWIGTAPNDYYLYTPSNADKIAARKRFHVTVPLTDRRAASYGSYPHITIDERKNASGKWKPSGAHWYIDNDATGKAIAYKSDGTVFTLNSDDVVFLEKVNADMKEYKALPWKSGAANKTK